MTTDTRTPTRPGNDDAPNAPHAPVLTDHASLVDLAMRMAGQLWAARHLARPGGSDAAANAATRRQRDRD